MLILLLSGLAFPASSDPASVAEICDSAASIAARDTGVPLDVLRAISLTETGRKSRNGFAPWPWTVNMEGIGKWFKDAPSAKAYVDRHFARGARSFDVGCFQINYKWHGQAFSSIEDMFDPILNARYAAKFLLELHDEFGDWSRAAGAYHSRTPKYANRYKARFDRIRANLPRDEVVARAETVPPEPNEPAAAKPRHNSYPFLVSDQRAHGPSLVPLQTSGRGLFQNRETSPLLGRP
ncbi:MAG: lytic transglycosylase domain-containing protein [Pseudomonadota bacterium]